MERNRLTTAPVYEPEISREPVIAADQPGIALLLWRSRRFLWSVLWKAAILSVIVAFLIPPKYVSTARIVPGDTSNTSMLAGLLAKNSPTAFGLDAGGLLGMKTPGAFYVEIIRSQTVQDTLINKFDLRAHYKKKYYEDARKVLTKNTDVGEDKKSGVITVSVRDWDKKMATDMVHEYVAQMNGLSTELNTSAAHREREFLEARLQEAKQDLDKASLELSEFSSKHSMVDVQSQGKSMMEAAARLQGELIAHESELRGLQQIYSDDSPRVRSLRATVADLRGQLKNYVGDYTDPQSAAAKDQSAPGSYPSIRTLPALGYRYQEIYRRAKTQEAVYEYLTQQYELARIQEAKELPVVRVMDPGTVPERKVSPKRSMVVGFSVFLSFCLACVWVVQKRRWDGLSEDDSTRQLVTEITADIRSKWHRMRNRG